MSVVPKFDVGCLVIVYLRENKLLCPSNTPNSIYTDPAGNEDLYIQSQTGNANHTLLNVSNAGRVGIGTNTPSAKLQVNGKTIIGSTGLLSTSQHWDDYQLAVSGRVVAQEIYVTLDGWADYVFAKDYQLKSLNEISIFIKENGHLPEIPAAQEVLQDGISLGDMNAKLLSKIEELYLHVIALDQKNNALQNEIELIKNNSK